MRDHAAAGQGDGGARGRVSVHPSAVVAEGARIPASCTVGPFCTVGPRVELGEGCTLLSHVVLDGHTVLGEGCSVHPFAAVGVSPQDLKYRDEPTRCEVGARTVIRESVTISRGTVGGGGVTRVGADCLIMTLSHIGHDTQVGEGVILANGATLAGHVVVEDFAVVGALNLVHQHCTVGRYAYLGGGTTVTQDVLPYSLTSGRRENRAFGLNRVGLERRGFTGGGAGAAAGGVPAAAGVALEYGAGAGGDPGEGSGWGVWGAGGVFGRVYCAK